MNFKQKNFTSIISIHFQLSISENYAQKEQKSDLKTKNDLNILVGHTYNIILNIKYLIFFHLSAPDSRVLGPYEASRLA